MFNFDVGQEVYVIHRIRNNKGVNKWHVVEDPRKIAAINVKVLFNKEPFKARRYDVFATYREAESRCEHRNHWGKYHKGNNYRGKRKK